MPTKRLSSQWRTSEGFAGCRSLATRGLRLIQPIAGARVLRHAGSGVEFPPAGTEAYKRFGGHDFTVMKCRSVNRFRHHLQSPGLESF
jgi:hypothetical protein